MKSGAYSMVFVCDGYRGYGSAEVNAKWLKGGSDRYAIGGQIDGSGSQLSTNLRIDLTDGVSGNAFIKGGFFCAMKGQGAEFSFNLYGLGPLGIIIGIECQWAGELEPRSTPPFSV
jgi:hypothetical protein